MKKIITAWLLIAALFSLSITAYAQDQTTGNITVTYEHTAPSGGGGSGDTSTYTINIPANVNINETEVVPITLSKNDIADGKKIVVRIDWDKTSDNPENEYLNLYKNKGNVDEESLICRIFSYTNSTLTTLVSIDDSRQPNAPRVAEFNTGSVNPTLWGYLHLKPFSYQLSTIGYGTYTGVLYFNISVEDI